MGVAALVYTSATGFTARYAALLAEETGLPALPLDQAAGRLDRGTEVLYLGWLCAGTIKGLKQAAKQFAVTAVCAVGMSPPDPAYTAKLARPDSLRQAPLFYLRGGYAPERLRGIYRPMMAAMGWAVNRAAGKNGDTDGMAEAFAHGGDWVDSNSLAPVVNWLQAHRDSPHA